MKILVSEIPDEGIDIEEEEAIGEGTGGLATKAVLSLRVEKFGVEVWLRGSIKTTLGLTCGRCLRDFASDLIIPAELQYRPIEEISGPDRSGEERRELSADELDTGFYKDNELDLGEVTSEQVLLNAPMKPLCSEACRGICPKCGANLNETSCGCRTGEADYRLEKLKEYLERKV